MGSWAPRLPARVFVCLLSCEQQSLLSQCRVYLDLYRCACNVWRLMWQCPLECVWEFELLMMLSFVDVPCVQMEMLRRPHVERMMCWILGWSASLGAATEHCHQGSESSKPMLNTAPPASSKTVYTPYPLSLAGDFHARPVHLAAPSVRPCISDLGSSVQDLIPIKGANLTYDSFSA